MSAACLIPRHLLRSFSGTTGLMWIQNSIPNNCPSFEVDASKVHIIREPNAFYEEIIRKIGQSHKRIALSSLYIGTGPKERRLVLAVNQALQQNPDLAVTLLSDYTRGRRTDSTNCSSSDVLKELVSDRCRVSFFLSSNFSKFFNRTFLLPNQKKNEIVSLQHMKCFVFDDDVIISGANLSEQYFENRADRYILFTGCKELADYFQDLISTVTEFSMNLTPEGKFIQDSSMQFHPLCNGTRSQFIREARTRVFNFKSRHNQKCDATSCQTWVTPLLQMNEFGIDEDTDFTCKLLSSIPDGSVLRLASGYFNLTKQYQDILLRLSHKVSCDILMASEGVNSFYKAKGLLGYIPSFYTSVSREFFRRMITTNSHIRLWSFYRPKWTFHTKGLWVMASDGFMLTTIGSSNFGYRSAYKDLELQVVIATKDADLQKRLNSEHESVWQHAKLIQSKADFPDVPLWVSLMSRWIKGWF